jgi:hypothetical protein
MRRRVTRFTLRNISKVPAGRNTLALTFVVHDVAGLLEVERIDHFVEPVVFVPVEVLGLASVSGAKASARHRRRTS